MEKEVTIVTLEQRAISLNTPVEGFVFTDAVRQQVSEHPNLIVDDVSFGRTMSLVFRTQQRYGEPMHSVFCIMQRGGVLVGERVGVGRTLKNAIEAIGFRESQLILARLQEAQG